MLLEQDRGFVLRQGQTWEVAIWEIALLGNAIIVKIPLGK